MAPHRPLTDLCIISVFKQMTPNEQMKASRMSPRSLLLVRAANRRLKSLIVRTVNTSRATEDIFRAFYFSKHCMQVIEDRLFYVSYLLNSRFSRWNCLLVQDAIKDEPDSSSSTTTTTVDQIVYIFSAVTDLKYSSYSFDEECEILIALLQHPRWAGQLTNLMLTGEYYTIIKDLILSRRVTAALNRLTALQLLSVKGDFADLDFSELTIFAQLKVIAVQGYSTPEGSILRAFQRTVPQKELQQVHLDWRFGIPKVGDVREDQFPFPDLLALSELKCRHIVGFHYVRYTSERHARVLRLCTKLTSLISLGIKISIPPQVTLQTTVVPFFTALSRFKQLLYLHLGVDFDLDNQSLSLSPLFPPMKVQLASVKALDLQLEIDSHDQVKWLNLTQTLPNCQVINLYWYSCSVCNVNLENFTDGLADYLDDSSSLEEEGITRIAALNCLKSTLTELHQGVHPSKLTFKYSDCPERFESSLEQLLLLK